jgi:hypothetical protein
MNRRIGFRVLFVGLTIGAFGAVSSFAQTQTGGRGTGRAAAPVSTPAWRTSWQAFSQAIDDYRKTEKEFPQASFQSLVKGQPVPETWAVMKTFTGQVTFEGTLKGFDEKNVMDGQPFKLDLDLGQSLIAWKHIYPKATSVDAWKAVQPGTMVKFRAAIKGVAGANPLKDAFAYMVLLQDAEIVK